MVDLQAQPGDGCISTLTGDVDAEDSAGMILILRGAREPHSAGLLEGCCDDDEPCFRRSGR